MGCKAAAQVARQIVKRDDGQSVIEYALTLIVFSLLMFGIVDFGRALYAYHFVSHAAREATRWAAVNGYLCDVTDNSCNGTGGMSNGPAQPADIAAYVAGLVPQGLNPAKVTTTPTWAAPAGSPAICTAAVNGTGPFADYPGCTVQVTVSYNFSFLVPLVSNGNVPLSSTSQMVIAH